MIRKNYTAARDACRALGAGYDIASATNHEEQGINYSIYVL